MRQRIAWLGTGAFVTVAIVAACGAASTSSSQSNDPSSPKDGWVSVWPNDNTTEKRCDGTTLIYWRKVGYGGGLTSIPNSPECQ